MAKVKKKAVEPEPVDEPKPTKWKKTTGFVKNNEKTLWRSFLTAGIAVLTMVAANGNEWVRAYMEKQKAQVERQVAWQVKAEARHQALLKNDSLIMVQNNRIIKHLKIK